MAPGAKNLRWARNRSSWRLPGPSEIGVYSRHTSEEDLTMDIAEVARTKSITEFIRVVRYRL